MSGRTTRAARVALTALAIAVAAQAGVAGTLPVRKILDRSDSPNYDFRLVDVDSTGVIYLTSYDSSKVLRLDPDGTLTEILSYDMDFFARPEDAVVDPFDNFWVPSVTGHLYRFAPNGTGGIVVDDSVWGIGGPDAVTSDAEGNIYAFHTYAGMQTLFELALDGAITPIDPDSGDPNAPQFRGEPKQLAVDGGGNLYFVSYTDDNAVRVTPGVATVEIIDESGDGLGNSLEEPTGITLDAAGNVYVSGRFSNNVFRIAPDGTIATILDGNGDRQGNLLYAPWEVVVDDGGTVYVAGKDSHNVFRVEPDGTVTEIVSQSGDGMGNELLHPHGLALYDNRYLYVTGEGSDNLFEVDLLPEPAPGLVALVALGTILGLRAGLSGQRRARLPEGALDLGETRGRVVAVDRLSGAFRGRQCSRGCDVGQR